MEQFRQIGEVVGGLKALMVFQDNLLNQRQCCLLEDMLNSGYKTIAQQMKLNLRFEEKNTKWKIIEHPLKELLRVFKEGETYIKQCLETKDWWAKAILLYQNNDCIEYHIHNLLTCMPIAIEAIELAGQISGIDEEGVQKKHLYSMKYHKDLKDPRTFQWIYGDQYLASQELCNRIESAWEEDRWFLLKKIRDRKNSGRATSKCNHQLADVLFRCLESSGGMDNALLPSSILVNSKDYSLRRRLGCGSQYREIQWLGETFVLRHFHGEVEPLIPEIHKEITLYHPNILQALCAFTDDEKKDCFLLMELMSKDLSCYVKEICGRKKQIPFSLPVAVDLMLQIARGMEYLHSKNIYHGKLNPTNILVKARSGSSEQYLHAKVSGFGISSSISSQTPRNTTTQNEQLPFIWYAPEVLAEQEQFGEVGNSKYSEKSDVYSFGMICFEVLTGKVPFEDTHLQGDKMSRNIIAGERPLFPFHSPKCITNLTKKCWHVDPNQRPGFSSICRMLRYAKRYLVMNPECNQPDSPMPPIDFQEIEAGIKRSCPSLGNSKLLSVTQIPFQMFVYRVIEGEKVNTTHQKDNSESGNDGSACGEENAVPVEEPLSPPPPERKPPLPAPEIMIRRLSLPKKSQEVNTKPKTNTQPGTPKGRIRSVRPTGRTAMRRAESQLSMRNLRTRRKSGHASDSELP